MERLQAQRAYVVRSLHKKPVCDNRYGTLQILFAGTFQHAEIEVTGEIGYRALEQAVGQVLCLEDAFNDRRLQRRSNDLIL